MTPAMTKAREALLQIARLTKDTVIDDLALGALAALDAEPAVTLSEDEREAMRWYGPWPKLYTDKVKEYHDALRHAFVLHALVERLTGEV